MIAVFDLDNCIANDLWRIGKINHEEPDIFKRYHDYHILSAFDAPFNLSWVIRHNDDDIVFATARPEFYRSMTEMWLKINGIPFNKLLMRRNDDHRPSRQLKIELLKENGIDFNQISHAYDDRLDVLKAYEEVMPNCEIVHLYIHNVQYGEKHDN